jgi:hypothetical protein
VKLEDVPEAARPYVERVQQLASARAEARDAELTLAKKGFDDARDSLNEWVKNIDASGDPQQAIAQEYVKLKADYEQAQAYVNEVEERNTVQSWDTFKRLHPEVETLPAETRAVFASNIERGLGLFDGETVIAKLEQALEFSMFKTGLGRQTTRVVDENVEEGRKQSMVASGRVPPAVPQPNNEGLSVDQIIRDAMYLLQD